MIIDPRPISRPDGLYRTCRMCGDEFKLSSDTIVAEMAVIHGERYIRRVEQTANYPRALTQLVCSKCQQDSVHDIPHGTPDPRAQLRAYGLESWLDYDD